MVGDSDDTQDTTGSFCSICACANLLGALSRGARMNVGPDLPISLTF